MSWRAVPDVTGSPDGWTRMEEAVLARWKADDVFHRSLELRAGAEPWVFYEGPPTANGRPGSHHVLSRVFKDIFPRFHTMRGRFVSRKAPRRLSSNPPMPAASRLSRCLAGMASRPFASRLSAAAPSNIPTSLPFFPLFYTFSHFRT